MKSDIDVLESKLARQERQINQMRAKIFDLHEAFVFSILNGDSSQEKVLPFEVEDNKSKKTIIAFGGMLTSLGMPKAEFFSSFKDKKDFNLIFIKDFWQSWYQRGLLGVSKDADSAAAYIKNLIPKESEEVFCIGTSAGGYGAILFAELLGAKKSLSFSPQTNIDVKTFLRFRAPESKWDEIKNSKYLNLKGVISGKVTHDVYTASVNVVDRVQAENLECCSCVKVHYIDTNAHNVAGYLKNIKELPSILNSFVYE